jgi:hypothetical protein
MTCHYQRRIFDTLRHAKVFSTLDLWFGYHEMPLMEGDKVKTTFWGIDLHENDYLYLWKFLPFSLKKNFTKFQEVMD